MQSWLWPMSKDTLAINFTDLEKKFYELGGGSDEQVQKALKTAVGRTTRWAYGQALKRLAKGVKVSSRILKNRVQFYIGDRWGKVWIGAYRIPIRDLGAKQNSRGVKAGPLNLPERFISPAMGGHVFKRFGKSRLPIRKEPGFEIEQQGNAAIQDVLPELNDKLTAEFERAFKWQTKST